VAIEYLNSKQPESPLEYSFGMSEAARGKFKSTQSLTDRLKAHGQWTGTCSDFVQLGIEDLDAHTIVSLMIISAGDEKRQIRERIFSADKNVVGVAIGSYKQSTAVAVTLSTKFVANAPTDEAEKLARGNSAAAVVHEHDGVVTNEEAASFTNAAIEAMHESNTVQDDDDYKTDAQLHQEQLDHIARLEASRQQPSNAQLTTGAEEDAEMAAIQQERLAALAALERGNQYDQSRFQEPEYDQDNDDEPPPHMQARDDGIESFEEAEAKKRAFLEEQERAKAEAIRKAEEVRKNKWKEERAAREAAKKKEEEERLKRLQQQGPGGFGGFGYGGSRPAYSSAPRSQPVNRPAPVNRAPEVVRQPSSQQVEEAEEMDELQRERMAKIAALENSNAYGGSSRSDMEDNENVVGQGADGPAEYDPTRESFEEAEARKRAWFEEQERKKQEAIRAAEEAQKNSWKAQRAAREAAKKKEEEERLARLQAESSGQRKFGGNSGSYGGSFLKSPRGQSYGSNIASASSAPVNSEPQPEVVRSDAHNTPYYGSGGTGGVDDSEKDEVTKEEERMMKALAKHGHGPRVDPREAKEAEMAERKKAAEERAARVKALKEEKWKAEVAEAERKAAARVAEAEAKAAALKVSPRPGSAAAPAPTPAAAAPAAAVAIPAAAAPTPAVEEPAPAVEEPAPAVEEPVPVVGGPPKEGSVDDAIAELQGVGEANPVVLYLNALYRDEESVKIGSLTEVREDVAFYTSTGHKVSREGKYAVGVAAAPDDIRSVRIPPAQLVNDDFNALSDYFFFGTADHLTLYPTADLNEAEVMAVSDLTTLSPDVKYFLASGNQVEVIGGANPQFLINGGEKEVALPEEVAEQLRY
jgi:hypothetical protein